MMLYEVEPFSKNWGGADTDALSQRIEFPKMEISRGGIIAIIGASGVGKSTLLHILAGLDFPDEVRSDSEEAPKVNCYPNIGLQLDGTRYDVANHQDLMPRDRMGFIFQAAHLLENQTVELNGVLPRLMNGMTYDAAAAGGRFSDLGIRPEQRHKRAWQLSGGEKQRVAFVRAISHDPTLLFADEPTASLDVGLSEKMMSVLKDWREENPERSVIWVTHNLRLALEFADSLIALPRSPVMKQLCADKEFVLRDLKLPDRSDTTTYEHDRDLERELERAMYASSPDEWRRALDHVTDGAVVARLDETTAQSTCRNDRPEPDGWLVDRLVDGEIYSRRTALENVKKCEPINRYLASPTKDSKIAAIRDRWFLFRPWPQLGMQFLTMVLAVAGGIVVFLSLADWRRTLDDPESCHMILTARLGDRSRFTPDVVKAHAKRPWRPEHVQRKIEAAIDESHLPPSSCGDGPALFGRVVNLEKAGVGLVGDGGRCIRVKGADSRVLIASPNEPVFKSIRFLPNPTKTAQSLDRNMSDTVYTHFVNEDYIQTDKEVVVSRFLKIKLDDKKKGLTPQQRTDIENDKICLAWGPDSYNLDLIGTVKHIPANRLDGFDIYITPDTYRGFNRNNNRLENMVTAAVYFSGFNREEFKKNWLEKNRKIWASVPDVLEQIDVKIRNEINKLVAVLVFCSIIFLIVGFFVRLLSIYLVLENEKSLAVLKCYGMTESFLVSFMRKAILRLYKLCAVVTAGAVVLTSAGWIGWQFWENYTTAKLPVSGYFEWIEPLLSPVSLLLGMACSLLLGFFLAKRVTQSIARDWYKATKSIPKTLS